MARGKVMIGDKKNAPYTKKSVYFNYSEVQFLEELKMLMKKYDEVMYGKDAVEEFEKSGKYSFSGVIRFLIENGGKMLIERMTKEIEDVKHKRKKRKKRQKSNENVDVLSKVVLNISPFDDYIWDRFEGGV